MSRFTSQFSPAPLVGILAVTGLAIAPAFASAAMLDADADTYVYNVNPDTNYGSSTALQVANDGGSPIPKTKDRMAVIRFDVSGELGPFLSANLALTSTTDFEFKLFGINDLGADELFDESTLTFNNFDYSSASGGDGSLVSAGLTELVTGVTDAGDGTADDVLNFSSDALRDFVNADTNGAVTFIVFHTSPQNGNFATFSSREAASGGPQLTLTTVPEPASAALVAMGGALMLGRRRR